MQIKEVEGNFWRKLKFVWLQIKKTVGCVCETQAETSSPVKLKLSHGVIETLEV